MKTLFFVRECCCEVPIDDYCDYVSKHEVAIASGTEVSPLKVPVDMCFIY